MKQKGEVNLCDWDWGDGWDMKLFHQYLFHGSHRVTSQYWVRFSIELRLLRTKYLTGTDKPTRLATINRTNIIVFKDVHYYVEDILQYVYTENNSKTDQMMIYTNNQSCLSLCFWLDPWTNWLPLNTIQISNLLTYFH